MTVRKVALAFVAGFAVFALFFVGSGTLSLPPTCYSLFGYVVPCDGSVAWAAGAATAGLASLLFWLSERRRERRGPTTG